MSTLVSVNDLEDRLENRWSSGPAIVLYLAAFKLLLHLMVAGKYAFMLDELYYIACSDHLDWGYVDHPPLIAFIIKAVRLIAGDSLFAMRFLPALAGAALVVLTGAITRTLGGGRFAQALAALGVIAVPLYLSFHHILSMNAFEPLFWAGFAYVVLLAVKRDDPKLLIWAGVILGFGLLNKYSIIFFAVAVCVGLLLTSHRKLLVNRWLLIALFIAFLIFAPHLNWLIVHHFPFLEWQRNIHAAGANGLIKVSPPVALLQELFLTGTASLLWVSGLAYFFVTSYGKPYRFLGLAFVIVMAALLAMHAKNYYYSPLYSIGIAGGAVALERWTSAGGWRHFRVALLALIIAGTALLAPMYLPILPVEQLLSYQKAIGMRPPAQETAMLGGAPLWPFLSGQFGWESLTAKTAAVYNSLPAEEREHATILTRTYAPAAAIDFYGKQYGLPKTISTHLGYFIWGPRDASSDTVIAVGFNPEEIGPACFQAEIREEMHSPYSWDINHPIILCRGLRLNFQKDWQSIKLWY